MKKKKLGSPPEQLSEETEPWDEIRPYGIFIFKALLGRAVCKLWFNLIFGLNFVKPVQLLNWEEGIAQ